MADTPERVDFDTRPPMPVAEYEQTVQRVNVGYDLALTLTGCFLKALQDPSLDVLVVGAGGGAEVERFLPGNPGWRLTGIDPSRDMLALAQEKADRLGVADRVSLLQGGVDAVPADARFGAATCLFVLHFLPDDEKRTLLRETAARLRPGAPLLVVTGTKPEDGGLRDDFLGAWQQYGVHMGVPPERMAEIVRNLAQQMAQHGATTPETYVRLLHEAGFERVGCYLSVLGAIVGWVAR